MSIISVLWFIAGIAAGSTHIRMLWRASQAPFRLAAWHWTRLLLIAAVFVTAAINGGILATAAGWGLAYFATIGVIAGRSPA